MVLLDFANKNTGSTVEFKYQINYSFQSEYAPNIVWSILKKGKENSVIYLKVKFNWASYILSDNLITKENMNPESKDTRNNAE